MSTVGRICGLRTDEKGRSVTREVRAGLAVATAAVCGCLGEAASEDQVPFREIRREFACAERAADVQSAATYLRRILEELPDARKQAHPHEQGLYGPLRQTLEQSIRTRSRAEQRALLLRGRRQLSSLQAALTLRPADPGIHPRATKKLQEVLARREFEHNDLRERMMAWVAKQVTRLLNWLMGHLNLDLSTSAGLVRALAVLLALAAIGLAGCLLAGGLGAVWRLRSSQRTEALPPDTSVEFSPRRARQRLLREAGQHAAFGEYRQAMRCFYHAIILTLHLAGLIDYDSNRTNREYLATLGASSSSSLCEAFDAATSLFERSWYGCQPSKEADATRMAELVRVVETSASSPQGS